MALVFLWTRRRYRRGEHQGIRFAIPFLPAKPRGVRLEQPVDGGMSGAKYRFVEGQLPLVNIFGFNLVALPLINAGQVVEEGSESDAVFATVLSFAGQHSPEQGFCGHVVGVP